MHTLKRLAIHGFIKNLMAALILIILAFPTYSTAEETPSEEAPYPSEGWSTFIRGGYVHQFDTDIDDGGDFSVGLGIVYPDQIEIPLEKLPGSSFLRPFVPPERPE